MISPPSMCRECLPLERAMKILGIENVAESNMIFPCDKVHDETPPTSGMPMEAIPTEFLVW